MLPTSLAIRRVHDGSSGNGFAWREAPPDVLRFARSGRLEVVVNLGTEPIALPSPGRVLLASHDLDNGRLPADAAAWLEVVEG